MLIKLLERTVNILTSQYNDLMIDINKDKDLEIFIDHLLFCMLEENKVIDPIKYAHSKDMCKLFWQLTNYDLISAITNPYHMQANWIYELNMFIGNYVYDDAYFTLYKDHTLYGAWTLKHASDSDVIYNINSIMEASLDNAKFYLSSKNLRGQELRNIMSQGVLYSGNVEKTLER